MRTVLREGLNPIKQLLPADVVFGQPNITIEQHNQQIVICGSSIVEQALTTVLTVIEPQEALRLYKLIEKLKPELKAAVKAAEQITDLPTNPKGKDNEQH